MGPSCSLQEAVPPALALSWLATTSLKQGLCKHLGDVVQANQVLCPRGVPCPVRPFFRLLAASLFLPASVLTLARSLITLAPMTKAFISHGSLVPFLSHFISFQSQVLTGMSDKERFHRNWHKHRRGGSDCIPSLLTSSCLCAVLSHRHYSSSVPPLL